MTMPSSRKQRQAKQAAIPAAPRGEYGQPEEVYTRPDKEIFFNLPDGLPVSNLCVPPCLPRRRSW